MALQWANDVDIVYACLDSDVSLPWRVTIGSSETVTSVQWYFHGAHATTKIGDLVHGQFHQRPSNPGEEATCLNYSDL